MNAYPVKLVFKVIQTFGLMDSEDYAYYKAKAEDDWKNIRTDKEAKETATGKDKILISIKEAGEQWYWAIAMAFISIFAIRSIQDYLHPGYDDDKEKEQLL